LFALELLSGGCGGGSGSPRRKKSSHSGLLEELTPKHVVIRDCVSFSYIQPSSASRGISSITPSPQETRAAEITNMAAITGTPILMQRLFITNISHNPRLITYKYIFFFRKK
jgi:hypothetical protein